MIKKTFLLSVTSIFVLLSTPFAHAVNLTVEQGPNGDRIRISQAEGDQSIQSLRVAPDTLFLQVNNASQIPVATPDRITGDLVNGFVPHNDGVSISLADTAFGFIQSQDVNGDILIDVYPDAMGARWRQSDNARVAYERLEEQQALPFQNPALIQSQGGQIPLQSTPTTMATPENLVNTPINTQTSASQTDAFQTNTSQVNTPQTNTVPMMENLTGQTTLTTQSELALQGNSGDSRSQENITPPASEPSMSQVGAGSQVGAENRAGTLAENIEDTQISSLNAQTTQNLDSVQIIQPEQVVQNPDSHQPSLSSQTPQNSQGNQVGQTAQPHQVPQNQENLPQTMESMEQVGQGQSMPIGLGANTGSSQAPVQVPTQVPLQTGNQAHNQVVGSQGIDTGTNSAQSTHLGTGLPYAPIQNQSSQTSASNMVGQNAQGSIQGNVNAGQQNTIPMMPLDSQGQNVGAPAQNINITLDNQANQPIQTPPQNIQTSVVQPSQSTQAPQINVNIQNSDQSAQQASRQALSQTLEHVSGQQAEQAHQVQPDININIQNETSTPLTSTPAQTSTQIPVQTMTQTSPQDININISNTTENATGLASENTPTTLATPQETANPNVNIHIEQESVQAQPTQAPVELEPVNTTSFTFSMSNKTESEADFIQPKEILTQKRDAELEMRRQQEAQLGVQTPQVTTQTQAITSTATPQQETSVVSPDQANLVRQDPFEQIGVPVEEINTIDQSYIPNPAPDPIYDGTGAPIMGEIIYLDEEGNVVPAPLNIPQTLDDMNKAAHDYNYEALLKATDLLRDKPLPPELLEAVLFNRAIALYHLDKDELKEKGAEVIRAATEVINLNPDSSKVPELLSIMVPSALAIDHMGEAKYAVDKLLYQYPTASETPSSVLLLAEKYYENREPLHASEYLDILINDYPTSPFIQEAAILQTKSIYSQGNLERTLTFLDFIDRRFDKVYLTAPEYFTIRGKIEEDAKRYDKVASTYLSFYNLDPKGKMADFALDKVANAYYALDQKDSARKILEELVLAFPESPYRASALLRIGENGIHDGNIPLQEMFDLFNEPNPNLPTIFYEQILREYPDSEEAKSARLRLAAQYLWEKEYIKSADKALAFLNEYVGTLEGDRSLEILTEAVAPVLSLAISEKNYEHALSLWEKYLPIQPAFTPYPAPLRMALGRALLNRRLEAEGEEMLAPFMDSVPTTQQEFEDGLYAYSITLANALKRHDWSKVLEVTAKVEDWDLPKDTGLQRLYSTALAAENLGLTARSLPIWHALAPNPEVPLYQRAYAQYFLARDAEKRQNLREAYQANLDTLAMFDDLHTQQSPYADLERNRESIAALMDITEIAGRYTESMQWLNRYRFFVPSDSPDYAGIQLREARLHKKMGDDLRWRSILEQVRDSEPESVFGKMAASELTSFEMARDLNRITTGR